MSFVLFALQHLLVVVSATAFVVACIGRLEPESRRWLWGWPALLIPLGYAGVAVGLSQLDVAWRHFSPWPYWLIPVLTAISVASFVTVVLGMRRKAPWPIGTLGLIAISTLLLHGITFWNLDSAARSQIAVKRSEAAMLAISLAPSHTPDRENAAPLYREVFRSGVLKANLPTEVASVWTDYATESRKIGVESDEVKAFLTRCEPALRRVREASRRQACDFERDWGRLDFTMLLPETQEMRSLARLLDLSAAAKHAAGDREGAIGELFALRQIAFHTSQEPILISMLVATAIETIACDRLVEVLDDPQLTSDELAMISDGFRPHPCYDWLHRALRVEEAAAVGSACAIAEGEFEQWFDGILHQPAPTDAMAPFYRVFMWSEDIRGYQTRMRSAIALVNNVSLANNVGLIETLPEQARRLVPTSPDAKASPLQVLFLPNFEAVIDAASRIEAKQRLLTLAIALRRQREETGAYPDSLDELAPHVLVGPDPFTGKPFLKASDENSLTIYSIGPDRTDHGGVPIKLDAAGAPTGDIVVRLRR